MYRIYRVPFCPSFAIVSSNLAPTSQPSSLFLFPFGPFTQPCIILLHSSSLAVHYVHPFRILNCSFIDLPPIRDENNPTIKPRMASFRDILGYTSDKILLSISHCLELERQRTELLGIFKFSISKRKHPYIQSSQSSYLYNRTHTKPVRSIDQ